MSSSTYLISYSENWKRSTLLEEDQWEKGECVYWDWYGFCGDNPLQHKHPGDDHKHSDNTACHCERQQQWQYDLTLTMYKTEPKKKKKCIL